MHRVRAEADERWRAIEKVNKLLWSVSDNGVENKLRR